MKTVVLTSILLSAITLFGRLFPIMWVLVPLLAIILALTALLSKKTNKFFSYFALGFGLVSFVVSLIFYMQNHIR
ncbi:MAG: hypothetical protein FWE37_00865 [Spirochaetaceae bacterium]|nr:hypothetical protein [Spirochaetaceae bacterium]